MRTTSIATLLALVTFGFDANAVIPQGAEVPDFQVEGVDGAQFRLSELAGRFVLVIFEDRACAAQNVSLKQRLWDLHRRGRLDDRLAVVPVADVRLFREWPASNYARKAVAAESKRSGRALFADFTGDAGTALNAKPGLSTLVLLDHDGRVIWSGEGPQDKPAQAKLIRMILERAGVKGDAKAQRPKAQAVGKHPKAGPKPVPDPVAAPVAETSTDAALEPRPDPGTAAETTP